MQAVNQGEVGETLNIEESLSDIGRHFDMTLHIRCPHRLHRHTHPIAKGTVNGTNDAKMQFQLTHTLIHGLQTPTARLWSR